MEKFKPFALDLQNKADMGLYGISTAIKDGKIIADPKYKQFTPLLHPIITEIPDTILPPSRCYSFLYNLGQTQKNFISL